MANIFNDTAAKKAYIIAAVAAAVGMYFVFTQDTSNVHGEGIITFLAGLFLIGLSILGLILFFVLRFFSK